MQRYEQVVAECTGTIILASPCDPVGPAIGTTSVEASRRRSPRAFGPLANLAPGSARRLPYGRALGAGAIRWLAKRFPWLEFALSRRFGLPRRPPFPSPAQRQLAHHLRVLRCPVDLTRADPERLVLQPRLGKASTRKVTPLTKSFASSGTPLTAISPRA